MSLSSIYGPGYAGYMQGVDSVRQKDQQNLETATGLMSLLQRQKALEQEAQMAPLRMKVLESQAAQAAAAVQDAQRKREFFSPANMQQFMTPGREEIPAPSAELGGGPGRPGQMPELDFNRLIMAGVSNGALSPEVMIRHQQQLQERQQARQQRMDELKLRLEDGRATEAERQQFRRELAQMQIDARRDMAYLAASLRPPRETAGSGGKPPVGYRFKPNGDLEAIPGGPADIKTQQNQERALQGANDVNATLVQLRDAYDRLEQGGGVTSTEKGPLSNASAAVSASAPGQVVGKFFGTKNQSARNEIAMSRPALLAAIMKATGMSSRQLDSNAELKLWIQTATDPTLDVQANRAALNNIEKRFLLKKPDAKQPEQPTSPSSGFPSAADIDAELARRQRGSNGSF